MKKKTFSRKKFLQLAGLSAAGIGLASCNDIHSIPATPPPELDLGPDPNPDDAAVYVGTDDTGLMNLLYVMAQMEVAFYTQVVDNFYSNITEDEIQLFNDIHQHEIAHRDFYQAFLAENAIEPVSFDFSSIDFNSRNEVLKMATKVEDRSISVYNGFSEVMQRTDFVGIISKIASVQGRHAAAVRLLKKPNSTHFIDPGIINANGLDAFMGPQRFPESIAPYIVEDLDTHDIFTA